jgi:integrase
LRLRHLIALTPAHQAELGVARPTLALADQRDQAGVRAGSAHAYRAPTFHQAYFRKARETAGWPDLRFHDLRHTGATLAAASGATIAELMQRLGHTTVSAALAYQHATQGSDQRIAAQLSIIALARGES